MSEDTVIALRQPETFEDPLTAVLRDGARRLLAQAVAAEVESFFGEHEHLCLEDGRRRLVRHGPEREILTGIGPVAVRRAKVRDRGGSVVGKIRFTSALLPAFARRSRLLDTVLPVLYPRGISTGDFQEALSALPGKGAPGLSAPALGRLKTEWKAEHARWRRRDLSARHDVSVWADGVYLQGRMEDAKQCMLVLIGATPEGKKEPLGFQTGFRESARSWRELLADLKERGLTAAPRPCHGGWRHGVLEGPGGDLSDHPPPTLLDAQDGQRPR